MGESQSGGSGRGKFFRNFLSLQLQLKTIFEDVGGDEVVSFLDTLSSMNKSEQKIALKLFTKTLSNLMSGSIRLETRGDLALKEFEDSLYSSLRRDIDEAQQAKGPRRISSMPRLAEAAVSKADSQTLIDLSAERKRRRGDTEEGTPLLPVV